MNHLDTYLPSLKFELHYSEDRSARWYTRSFKMVNKIIIEIDVDPDAGTMSMDISKGTECISVFDRYPYHPEELDKWINWAQKFHEHYLQCHVKMEDIENDLEANKFYNHHNQL